MVIVMRLNHISISKEDLMHKPQMDSAPKLHKLFNKDSAPFELPSARDIILERLTWNKWFTIELKDICVPFSEDAESQELCRLINVDWEDLDVSVIDKYLEDKKTKCVHPLTFRDFR